MMALPRSGTAWASVWLDAIHDPWATIPVESFPAGARACCTGTWLYPGLLATIKCPVVVLDRPTSRGLLPEWALARFDTLAFPRFPWTDLWSNPEPIWRLLRPDEPFDAARHARLALLNIQNEAYRVGNYSVDPRLLDKLRAYA